MREGLERYLLLMDFGSELKHLFALLSICSARMLAAMLVMPPMSSQRLPGALRTGLPAVLGIYVAWGQPYSTVTDLSALAVALLMLKETLVGLLLGFAASTIFWVAEGVGALVDNLAGYNNVQQSNPQSSDQATPVGNLLGEIAVYSFYSLGGLLAFVGTLFESYRWWPLALGLPKGSDLIERFAELQIGGYIASVARLAAPAMLVLVLIDLSIGLLTKIAEKLEANSMSQPIKGATAMILLSLIIGVFFRELQDKLSLQGFAQEIRSYVILMSGMTP